MSIHYIYITTNLINNKKYLGQRKSQNTNINKDYYLGSGTMLLLAIKKYGKNNFSKEIIFTCDNRKEIDLAEIKYIKEYNCLNNKDYWYNLSPGGQNWRKDHSNYVSEVMKSYYSNPVNKANLLKATAKKFGFNTYDEYLIDKENKEIDRKRLSKLIRIKKQQVMVLKQNDIKRYKNSSEYKALAKNKRVTASRNTLSNAQSRISHKQKLDKDNVIKMRKHNNPLYNFLLNNNLYPFKENIKDIYFLASYRTKRIKDINRVNDKLLILATELKERHDIILDVNLFLILYGN
jgi:hypothetical protein